MSVNKEQAIAAVVETGLDPEALSDTEWDAEDNRLRVFRKCPDGPARREFLERVARLRKVLEELYGERTRTWNSGFFAEQREISAQLEGRKKEINLELERLFHRLPKIPAVISRPPVRAAIGRTNALLVCVKTRELEPGSLPKLDLGHRGAMPVLRIPDTPEGGDPPPWMILRDGELRIAAVTPELLKLAVPDEENRRAHEATLRSIARLSEDLRELESLEVFTYSRIARDLCDRSLPDKTDVLNTLYFVSSPTSLGPVRGRVDKYAEIVKEVFNAGDTEYQARMERREVGTYIVVTDEEANRLVEEQIGESLWAFRATFISGFAGLDESAVASLEKTCADQCEQANPLVAGLVGWADPERRRKFVSAAIAADGRGHFLSGWDGKEREVDVEGKTLFVYYECHDQALERHPDPGPADPAANGGSVSPDPGM